MRRNVRVHSAGSVTVPATVDVLGVSGSALSGTAVGFAQEENADAEADWTTRSTGSGVFYSNNFSQYADTDALWADRDKGTWDAEAGRELALSTSGNLSGGKAIALTQKDIANRSGSWGQTFNGQKTEWYWQCSIYFNEALKKWRFDGVSAFEEQTKIINFEQFGSGQVVLNKARLNPGPAIMVNGGGQMSRLMDDPAPYSSGFSEVLTSALGNGQVLNTPTTLEEVVRTFGWDWTGINSNEWGETALEYDSDFIGTVAAGGDPTKNYLDDAGRGGPYGGWPFASLLPDDFVEYVADGWLTVEVYVKTSATSSARQVQLWAAPYGDPPKLISSMIIAGEGAIANTLAHNSSYYSEWELLIYNTPTVDLGEDRAAAVGYQPDLTAKYAEIIISSEPIPFPNPGATLHPLVQAPSALSNLSLSLAVGENATTVSPTWSGDTPASTSLNWTNKMFHDPARNIIWGMLQAHGGNFAYHFEWDLASNTVTCAHCNTGIFTSGGHTYDIPSYDPVTGNRYYINGASSDQVMVWEPGNDLDDWSFISADAEQDFGTGAPLASNGTFWDTSSGAMCWNPDLFGGSGGLLIVCRRGVAAYDPSMGTSAGAFVEVIPNGSWGSGVSNPCAVHIDGYGTLISNNANGNDLWLVEDENTFSALAAPPLPISVDAGGGNAAKMWAAPDKSTAYLIEINGGGDVYKFNVATEEFESFGSHPFSAPAESEDLMGTPLHSFTGLCFVAAERHTSSPFVRFRVARL